MKRIALLFTTAFLISGLAAHGQKVKPDYVAGICEIELQDGVDMTNDQLESFYLEEFIPAFNKVFPSLPLTLMKGDRGERKGKYAEFYVFESLEARNKWWPEDAAAREETYQGFKKMGDTWDKYNKIFKSVAFTDYIILPFPGKSFEVKQGNVVNFYEFECNMKEGLTPDQFEIFYLEKFVPATNINFPGTEICLLKGNRGERTGKYVEFWVVESLKERNRWFPEPNKPSEEAKKAFNTMGEIHGKLGEMISGVTFTGYIVL